MFKAILAVLTARWFITLIGAIALSAIVWFAGPLIAVADIRPLESDISRMGTIVVIMVLWGLINLFSLMRAKRTNDRLIEDIAAPSVSPDAAATEEEVAILRERLGDALGLLKRAKLGGAGGRQHLYQLPWYVIIGPPGSGKTTALVNSGLSFPLAERYGRDAVQGVGGTRNCDWWFTNEAVLIDTAGRYTTQDSHKAVDAGAWSGFLKLLKKSRPRQPINGAIIAISLADLATLPEGDRIGHARAVRQRIQELHEELGVRFPVYVLFTKADLIAGFVEFFDDLGREEREQVWGTTFAFDDGKSPETAVAGFSEAFDALIDRLNDRMLARVHQEPDIARRSLIYGFPAQVASLKDAARRFLDEVFAPSRYEQKPLLRGVYLSSGTQEGTPIDRLMGAMAASFGLDRQRLSAFSGQGRSYFLTRLLKNVVFPEAAVVSTNTKVERRRVLLHRGAIALASVGVVVMLGAWAWSFQGNRGLVKDVEAGIARYGQEISTINPNVVADDDVGPVLPALATVRDLPGGWGHRDDGAPLDLTLGLYQGGKLGSQAEAAYRRALGSLFLPRLLVRLEDQLRANIGNPAFVYEGLKVYLMLGGIGPMDTELVQQWMAIDWAATWPGQANEALRNELTGHLTALLEGRMPEIALDGNLVAAARDTLARFPLHERAYALIQQSQDARALPEWRIVDYAGPAAPRVFVRPSGRSLSEGVPGLYTYVGFHGIFLPASAEVAREVAGEAWVLGTSAAGLDDAEVARLQADVTQLYFIDYIAQWDGILADIAIIPFQSLGHAVETLNIISGPTSPLRALLVAIADETLLTAPPDPAAAGEGEGVALPAGVAAGLQARAGRAGRLAGLLGQALGGGEQPAEALPGQPVVDHFRPLHEMVIAPEGAPAPIDGVITTLNQLYGDLQRMSTAINQGGRALEELQQGGAGASVQQLLADAPRMPDPLSGIMEGVAQASTSLTVGGAKSQVDGLWQSGVKQLCQRALNGRYPMNRGSQTDVNLDDFTQLFSPGGRIDQFFNTNLAPFVDMSTRPWRWARVGNTSLGISDDALMQFQRAADIRDAFFATGAAGASFELVPVTLDASATQVLIDLDGQQLLYNHGPPRPASMKWPGPGGTGQVRISFSPPLGSAPSTITKNGPWSTFRLFDEGRIAAVRSDRFTVTFNVGGRSATFELRAGSVNNPFSMPALREFRCPDSL